MQEMKYFNEGNDCDICKNQLMTGRDGTVEDCPEETEWVVMQIRGA